jgi:SPP1 family predicted phage head-tail adaptor
MPAEMGPKKIGNMWKRLQIQVPPGWVPVVPGQATLTNEFNEIVLQDIRPAQDGYATIATVWGEVTALTGRELFLAQQVRPDITTRVTVRYWKGNPRLSPRMRFFLAAENRKVNIAYVLPGQKRRWQELLCREEIA